MKHEAIFEQGFYCMKYELLKSLQAANQIEKFVMLIVR